MPAEPWFAAYVRQRGRALHQTGFSDAGRHLGQTVAAISVEWLRLKLADLMRERGFTDVRTGDLRHHGGSIGRGHPEDFIARLGMSLRRRAAFISSAMASGPRKVSFQGGDGCVYFITPEIAFASMTRILGIR